MESNRRTTTVRQLKALLEFVEGHRDLALGRVRSKEARALADRWWRECAELLNRLGPARTAKEWAKVWNDQKCRVRAKFVSANSSHRATSGGPSNAPSLTPLEKRIANIIGRNVGPLPNVRQDQFAQGGGPSNAPSLTPLEERIANIIGRDVGPLPNVRQDQFAHPGGDGLNMVVMEEVENIEEAFNLNIPRNEVILLEIDNSVPPPQQPSHQEEPVQNIELPREAAEKVIRAPGRCTAERTSSLPSTSTQPAPSTSRPTQPSEVQVSKKGLEESRAMRCEELRAQTDLINSESMRTIVDSFRLIAKSIDRFSRQSSGQSEGDVPDSSLKRNRPDLPQTNISKTNFTPRTEPIIDSHENAECELFVPVSVKSERTESPSPQTIDGRSSPDQSSPDDPLHTGRSRPASRGTASIASNTKRENEGTEEASSLRRRRIPKRAKVQTYFQRRMLEIEQKKINLERQKVTELSGIRIALNQLTQVMKKSS